MSTPNKEKEFVNGMSRECRSCEKASTNVCPAFRQAVENGDVDAEKLAALIQNAQKNESLRECSKA